MSFPMSRSTCLPARLSYRETSLPSRSMTARQSVVSTERPSTTSWISELRSTRAVPSETLNAFAPRAGNSARNRSVFLSPRSTVGIIFPSESATTALSGSSCPALYSQSAFRSHDRVFTARIISFPDSSPVEAMKSARALSIAA